MWLEDNEIEHNCRTSLGSKRITDDELQKKEVVVGKFFRARNCTAGPDRQTIMLLL